MRLFEPKVVPRLKLLPLAAAYVGYIVLCNLNLNINPVGFYQITKIAGGCWRPPRPPPRAVRNRRAARRSGPAPAPPLQLTPRRP